MNALREFKKRLEEFATGRRRGIRNPFVIVPIKPSLEYLLSKDIERWVDEERQPTKKIIYLDRIFPQTRVFRITKSLPSSTPKDSIEKTLYENLGEEMVRIICQEERKELQKQDSIFLLLKLGSLYPFTRASIILDELDRLNVRSTIGIPFPGEFLGGKLSFFGEDAKHYYPAHCIESQIKEVDLP